MANGSQNLTSYKARYLAGGIAEVQQHLDVIGTIYFHSGTDASSGKSILAYNGSNLNYGMRYFDASTDVLTLSATNNNNSKTGADFSINGLGKGILSHLGNYIPHTGNTTGTVGSTEQPVYVKTGTISSTTYALKATVNSGNASYVAYYENDRLISSAKPTFNMRMPAHYYHNLYEDNPTTGTTVYVHYYNTDTTSTNTYANLRVKSGSTFKTFVFGGDGNCSWEGHILASGGYLKSTANGNTVQIGSQNTGYCHITNSANIPFQFNKEIQVDGNIMPYTSTTRLLGDTSHEWLSTDTRTIYVRHIDSSRNFTDDQNIYYGYNRGLHHLFYSCNNGASRVHSTTIDVDGIWCKSGWFRSYGNTGWYNESYGGGWWMQDSTWIRAFNGKSVYVDGTVLADRLEINTGTNPEGNNTLGHGISLYHDSEGGNITIYSGNVASYGSYYWEIDAYNGDLRAYNVNSAGTYKGQITIRKDNVVLFGAAWNDYAEMRNVPEANDYGQEGQQSKMAGRCVQEVGDDTMIMTNDRLQLGCKIVSDTFGFNIGETEECKTPIAVSGRVLAYLYEGREAAKSHIGRPVCSGPNGTVSIMTEDEEKAYPSRIVGIISAVPDYKYWGTGNVEVNGRIWIYVH